MSTASFYLWVYTSRHRVRGYALDSCYFVSGKVEEGTEERVAMRTMGFSVFMCFF